MDRRIILKWILRKYGSRVCGLYSSDSGHGPTASSHENSSSTKSKEFFEQLKGLLAWPRSASHGLSTQMSSATNLIQAGAGSLALFMKLLQFVFVTNEVREAQLCLTQPPHSGERHHSERKLHASSNLMVR